MSTDRHIALHGEGISLAVVPCGHSSGCGCRDISDCCFKCPLKDCRFGTIGGAKAIRAMSRNQEIVRIRSLGKTICEISDRFKLSEGTISKILRKSNC